jgi:hypothetical protein
LGSGMIRQPIAQVARDARPWLVGSLIGMLVTGLPQLMQNAMREYYSEFFWQKMYFLAAALIFTFTVRRKVAFSTEDRFNPALGKVVALVSIVLWGGVIVSGRLIGLFT